MSALSRHLRERRPNDDAIALATVRYAAQLVLHPHCIDHAMRYGFRQHLVTAAQLLRLKHV